MTRSVGIDLGTTNSLVGFQWRGKDTIVLDPQTNREWIPSLVGLDHGGAFAVGHSVEALVEAGLATGVHSVKRLMGRQWDDPQVQRLIEERRLFYEIKAHPDLPGEIGVVIGERILTPVEVSSMILRHLRTTAREQAGEEISHAVITVPAYFRDPAIYATREAGRLAGLRVKHIMPEPTAAAAAYGAGELNDAAGRYVLVFDFGGGTFDVSVMLAVGGALNVLRVGGDNFLGGDDIDRVVMQRFDDQLQAAHSASILTGAGMSGADKTNLRALQWRLKIAARQAKEALSSTESATVVRPSLFATTAGQLVNATWALTRADLARIAAPFIDRAFDAVASTLEEAHIKPSDIGQVVVAGGSSRLPGVVDRLRTMFPDSEILNVINPMTAIATGAIRTSRNPFPWKCPACDRDNELTATSCIGCNAAAPTEHHTCERCGALMSVTEEVCPSPQCATRVTLSPVPIEAVSHDYRIRLVDGEWETLIDRDMPVDASQLRGTESSPWVALATTRSRMEFIDLPIAQATDDSSEAPAVVATFRAIGAPTDLPAGEKVEVRLHLSGDQLARAEVRIRGTIHRTRRLEFEEVAAIKAEPAPASDERWKKEPTSHVGWLRLLATGPDVIPGTSRTSEGDSLIEEFTDFAEECGDRADRLEAEIERGDRRAAEATLAASQAAVADAEFYLRTVPVAAALIRMMVGAHPAALQSGLNYVNEQIRAGVTQSIMTAFVALSSAVRAALDSLPDRTDDDDDDADNAGTAGGGNGDQYLLGRLGR